MIFAAGLGSRLKPWTDNHPKALVPVNGKSLLQRNVEYLQYYKIDQVVVNVHHFSDQIINAVVTNKGWGSEIVISDESDEVLETGGGLLKAASLLSDADIILTLNADILTDLKLDEMINFHFSNQSMLTVAVTDRPGSRKLLFNENMQLCGWRNNETEQERIAINIPKLQEWAFSGITIMKPSIFNIIERKGKFSMLDVLLDAAPNHKVSGFNHSGSSFIDVGKPGSIEKAEALFL